MLRYIPFLLLLLPFTSSAELQISDSWIKNLPPPVPVRAGYMTIENTGPAAITVRSVRSQAFTHIEIHQTVEKDGMMGMEPVPDLTIEAGSTVQLAPGGLHLMMMQPVNPTKPGDIIRIIIVFEDGSEQMLDMEVRK